MIVRLMPALLVALLAVAGCKNQPKPADTNTTLNVVDTNRVAEVRGLYQQVNPNTRVGYVNAILADDELASVVDVPVADFKTGDAVTFVDINQSPIANGRVVNVLPDAIHVHYIAVERAPKIGDIAVKFIR